MRKHFAISTLLSVSMILSSLSCIPGRMAWAAEQTQGRIAAASISGKSTAAPQALPADQNDPGYERLTGQYEPAAEENISGAGSAVSTFSADAAGLRRISFRESRHLRSEGLQFFRKRIHRQDLHTRIQF